MTDDKGSISSPQDFDEVAPDASAMIESMRAYGYTFSTAIADLIDNSIAAGCTTVWIHSHWAGEDSWVSVTDDGVGMTEEELRHAMRLGSRSPVLAREPSDLGRFGLGLKTASFSQCRRLSVASRYQENPVVVRRWDLDHLARSDVSGWQLLRTLQEGSEERIAAFQEMEQGTVVLWEVLDRVVGKADRGSQRLHQHFLETIDAAELHLAMVFHRYLAGPNPRLRILLNGHAVAAWDPFLQAHPATQPTPSEPISLPEYDDPVVVRGYVLPHKDRLGDADHQSASGPAGWNAQQGFYLYRNERLIVAGSWLGLGGSRPWTKEEHYKLARIQLDIPNSMDHLWQLDVKKSSATPPPLIRERLKGLAHGVRQKARQVFAHRGRYRGRLSRKDYYRAWKVQRRAGGVFYRIDREHPLVHAVLAQLPESLQPSMDVMLRILEETVPVEQIWLDTAEAPDSVRRPFHGATARQLQHHIQIAYEAVRRIRELDHREALSLLLEQEEFASEEAQAIIGALGDGEPS